MVSGDSVAFGDPHIGIAAAGVGVLGVKAASDDGYKEAIIYLSKHLCSFLRS